ncbi:hypothetical protein [Micromonospora sp. KLBMP9576]|uniref:hypothetical protein n=1 Tax=Micromonospora sp. KLBMP9576 TaxID=3424769 RepID=UPI003D8C2330
MASVEPVLPDPANLRAEAAEWDAQADRLVLLGQNVLAAVNSTVWSGQAGPAAGKAANGLNVVLGQVADSARSWANQLRYMANQTEKRIKELEKQFIMALVSALLFFVMLPLDFFLIPAAITWLAVQVVPRIVSLSSALGRMFVEFLAGFVVYGIEAFAIDMVAEGIGALATDSTFHINKYEGISVGLGALLGGLFSINYSALRAMDANPGITDVPATLPSNVARPNQQSTGLHSVQRPGTGSGDTAMPNLSMSVRPAQTNVGGPATGNLGLDINVNPSRAVSSTAVNPETAANISGRVDIGGGSPGVAGRVETHVASAGSGAGVPMAPQANTSVVRGNPAARLDTDRQIDRVPSVGAQSPPPTSRPLPVGDTPGGSLPSPAGPHAIAPARLDAGRPTTAHGEPPSPTVSSPAGSASRVDPPHGSSSPLPPTPHLDAGSPGTGRVGATHPVGELPVSVRQVDPGVTVGGGPDPARVQRVLDDLPRSLAQPTPGRMPMTPHDVFDGGKVASPPPHTSASASASASAPTHTTPHPTTPPPHATTTAPAGFRADGPPGAEGARAETPGPVPDAASVGPRAPAPGERGTGPSLQAGHESPAPSRVQATEPGAPGNLPEGSRSTPASIRNVPAETVAPASTRNVPTETTAPASTRNVPAEGAHPTAPGRLPTEHGSPPATPPRDGHPGVSSEPLAVERTAAGANGGHGVAAQPAQLRQQPGVAGNPVDAPVPVAPELPRAVGGHPGAPADSRPGQHGVGTGVDGAARVREAHALLETAAKNNTVRHDRLAEVGDGSVRGVTDGARQRAWRSERLSEMRQDFWPSVKGMALRELAPNPVAEHNALAARRLDRFVDFFAAEAGVARHIDEIRHGVHRDFGQLRHGEMQDALGKVAADIARRAGMGPKETAALTDRFSSRSPGKVLEAIDDFRAGLRAHRSGESPEVRSPALAVDRDRTLAEGRVLHGDDERAAQKWATGRDKEFRALKQKFGGYFVREAQTAYVTHPSPPPASVREVDTRYTAALRSAASAEGLRPNIAVEYAKAERHAGYLAGRSRGPDGEQRLFSLESLGAENAARFRAQHGAAVDGLFDRTFGPVIAAGLGPRSRQFQLAEITFADGLRNLRAQLVQQGVAHHETARLHKHIEQAYADAAARGVGEADRVAALQRAHEHIHARVADLLRSGGHLSYRGPAFDAKTLRRWDSFERDMHDRIPRYFTDGAVQEGRTAAGSAPKPVDEVRPPATPGGGTPGDGPAAPPVAGHPALADFGRLDPRAMALVPDDAVSRLAAAYVRERAVVAQQPLPAGDVAADLVRPGRSPSVEAGVIRSHLQGSGAGITSMSGRTVVHVDGTQIPADREIVAAAAKLSELPGRHRVVFGAGVDPEAPLSGLTPAVRPRTVVHAPFLKPVEQAALADRIGLTVAMAGPPEPDLSAAARATPVDAEGRPTLPHLAAEWHIRPSGGSPRPAAPAGPGQPGSLGSRPLFDGWTRVSDRLGVWFRPPNAPIDQAVDIRGGAYARDGDVVVGVKGQPTPPWVAAEAEAFARQLPPRGGDRIVWLGGRPDEAGAPMQGPVNESPDAVRRQKTEGQLDLHNTVQMLLGRARDEFDPVGATGNAMVPSTRGYDAVQEAFLADVRALTKRYLGETTWHDHSDVVGFQGAYQKLIDTHQQRLDARALWDEQAGAARARVDEVFDRLLATGDRTRLLGVRDAESDTAVRDAFWERYEAFITRSLDDVAKGDVAVPRAPVATGGEPTPEQQIRERLDTLLDVELTRRVERYLAGWEAGAHGDRVALAVTATDDLPVPAVVLSELRATARQMVRQEHERLFGADGDLSMERWSPDAPAVESVWATRLDELLAPNRTLKVETDVRAAYDLLVQHDPGFLSAAARIDVEAGTVAAENPWRPTGGSGAGAEFRLPTSAGIESEVKALGSVGAEARLALAHQINIRVDEAVAARNAARRAEGFTPDLTDAQLTRLRHSVRERAEAMAQDRLADVTGDRAETRVAEFRSSFDSLTGDRLRAELDEIAREGRVSAALDDVMANERALNTLDDANRSLETRYWPLAETHLAISLKRAHDEIFHAADRGDVPRVQLDAEWAARKDAFRADLRRHTDHLSVADTHLRAAAAEFQEIEFAASARSVGFQRPEYVAEVAVVHREEFLAAHDTSLSRAADRRWWLEREKAHGDEFGRALNERRWRGLREELGSALRRELEAAISRFQVSGADLRELQNAAQTVSTRFLSSLDDTAKAASGSVEALDAVRQQYATLSRTADAHLTAQLMRRRVAEVVDRALAEGTPAGLGAHALEQVRGSVDALKTHLDGALQGQITKGLPAALGTAEQQSLLSQIWQNVKAPDLVAATVPGVEAGMAADAAAGAAASVVADVQARVGAQLAGLQPAAFAAGTGFAAERARAEQKLDRALAGLLDTVPAGDHVSRDAATTVRNRILDRLDSRYAQGWDHDHAERHREFRSAVASLSVSIAATRWRIREQLALGEDLDRAVLRQMGRMEQNRTPQVQIQFASAHFTSAVRDLFRSTYPTVPSLADHKAWQERYARAMASSDSWASVYLVRARAEGMVVAGLHGERLERARQAVTGALTPLLGLRAHLLAPGAVGPAEQIRLVEEVEGRLPASVRSPDVVALINVLTQSLRQSPVAATRLPTAHTQAAEAFDKALKRWRENPPTTIDQSADHKAAAALVRERILADLNALHAKDWNFDRTRWATTLRERLEPEALHAAIVPSARRIQEERGLSDLLDRDLRDQLSKITPGEPTHEHLEAGAAFKKTVDDLFHSTYPQMPGPLDHGKWRERYDEAIGSFRSWVPMHLLKTELSAKLDADLGRAMQEIPRRDWMNDELQNAADTFRRKAQQHLSERTAPGKSYIAADVKEIREWYQAHAETLSGWLTVHVRGQLVHAHVHQQARRNGWHAEGENPRPHLIAALTGSVEEVLSRYQTISRSALNATWVDEEALVTEISARFIAHLPGRPNHHLGRIREALRNDLVRAAAERPVLDEAAGRAERAALEQRLREIVTNDAAGAAFRDAELARFDAAYAEDWNFDRAPWWQSFEHNVANRDTWSRSFELHEQLVADARRNANEALTRMTIKEGQETAADAAVGHFTDAVRQTLGAPSHHFTDSLAAQWREKARSLTEGVDSWLAVDMLGQQLRQDVTRMVDQRLRDEARLSPAERTAITRSVDGEVEKRIANVLTLPATLGEAPSARLWPRLEKAEQHRLATFLTSHLQPRAPRGKDHHQVHAAVREGAADAVWLLAAEPVPVPTGESARDALRRRLERHEELRDGPAGAALLNHILADFDAHRPRWWELDDRAWTRKLQQHLDGASAWKATHERRSAALARIPTKVDETTALVLARQPELTRPAAEEAAAALHAKVVDHFERAYPRLERFTEDDARTWDLRLDGFLVTADAWLSTHLIGGRARALIEDLAVDDATRGHLTAAVDDVLRPLLDVGRPAPLPSLGVAEQKSLAQEIGAAVVRVAGVADGLRTDLLRSVATNPISVSGSSGFVAELAVVTTRVDDVTAKLVARFTGPDAAAARQAAGDFAALLRSDAIQRRAKSWHFDRADWERHVAGELSVADAWIQSRVAVAARRGPADTSQHPASERAFLDMVTTALREHHVKVNQDAAGGSRAPGRSEPPWPDVLAGHLTRADGWVRSHARKAAARLAFATLIDHLMAVARLPGTGPGVTDAESAAIKQDLLTIFDRHVAKSEEFGAAEHRAWIVSRDRLRTALDRHLSDRQMVASLTTLADRAVSEHRAAWRRQVVDEWEFAQLDELARRLTEDLAGLLRPISTNRGEGALADAVGKRLHRTAEWVGAGEISRSVRAVHDRVRGQLLDMIRKRYPQPAGQITDGQRPGRPGPSSPPANRPDLTTDFHHRVLSGDFSQHQGEVLDDFLRRAGEAFDRSDNDPARHNTYLELIREFRLRSEFADQVAAIRRRLGGLSARWTRENPETAPRLAAEWESAARGLAEQAFSAAAFEMDRPLAAARLFESRYRDLVDRLRGHETALATAKSRGAAANRDFAEAAEAWQAAERVLLDATAREVARRSYLDFVDAHSEAVVGRRGAAALRHILNGAGVHSVFVAGLPPSSSDTVTDDARAVLLGLRDRLAEPGAAEWLHRHLATIVRELPGREELGQRLTEAVATVLDAGRAAHPHVDGEQTEAVHAFIDRVTRSDSVLAGLHADAAAFRYRREDVERLLEQRQGRIKKTVEAWLANPDLRTLSDSPTGRAVLREVRPGRLLDAVLPMAQTVDADALRALWGLLDAVPGPYDDRRVVQNVLAFALQVRETVDQAVRQATFGIDGLLGSVDPADRAKIWQAARAGTADAWLAAHAAGFAPETTLAVRAELAARIEDEIGLLHLSSQLSGGPDEVRGSQWAAEIQALRTRYAHYLHNGTAPTETPTVPRAVDWTGAPTEVRERIEVVRGRAEATVLAALTRVDRDVDEATRQRLTDESTELLDHALHRAVASMRRLRFAPAAVAAGADGLATLTEALAETVPLRLFQDAQLAREARRARRTFADLPGAAGPADPARQALAEEFIQEWLIRFDQFFGQPGEWLAGVHSPGAGRTERLRLLARATGAAAATDDARPVGVGALPPTDSGPAEALPLVDAGSTELARRFLAEPDAEVRNRLLIDLVRTADRGVLAVLPRLVDRLDAPTSLDVAAARALDLVHRVVLGEPVGTSRVPAWLKEIPGDIKTMLMERVLERARDDPSATETLTRLGYLIMDC